MGDLGLSNVPALVLLTPRRRMLLQRFLEIPNALPSSVW
jgi:hypothetical protein